MNTEAISFDPGLMLTAALDSLVENWASQCADAESQMHMKADIYESIAKACTIKAQIARAFCG
jgi:hypothetical protein